MYGEENKFCRFCGSEVKTYRAYDFDTKQETIIRECDFCHHTTERENKNDAQLGASKFG